MNLSNLPFGELAELVVEHLSKECETKCRNDNQRCFLFRSGWCGQRENFLAHKGVSYDFVNERFGEHVVYDEHIQDLATLFRVSINRYQFVFEVVEKRSLNYRHVFEKLAHEGDCCRREPLDIVKLRLKENARFVRENGFLQCSSVLFWKHFNLVVC